MLRRFFKYLLVGCSAMVLLVGANFVLAEDHGPIILNQPLCLDDDAGRSHAYWVTRYEDGFEEKEGPNELCGCRSGEVLQDNQCITPQPEPASEQPAQVEPAQVEPAQVEPAPSQPEAPAAVVETPSQWECERALDRGENICNDNITFCEATGWSGNSVVSATLMLKHKGVCDPSHGERDARGCIFEFTPVRAFNYSTPQPDNLFGVASACPAEVSAPAQEAPAQAAAAAQQVQCVVCDQGRYRLSVMCTNAPICNINNPNQGPCVGAAVGQECPPRPAPAVPPPAAPAATATGGAGGAGGSSTVTITHPAQGVAQVVLTRTVSAADGNVGVGTTVISGQVLGVKELPKTGLPALVWSVLAFIPTGFGLRKFSRVKKDLQNHPEFIWEDRQFKFGS